MANKPPTVTIEALTAVRLQRRRCSGGHRRRAAEAAAERSRRSVRRRRRTPGGNGRAGERPASGPARALDRDSRAPAGDGRVVDRVAWSRQVAFEPRYAQPKDGQSETRATFSAPGEYCSGRRLTTARRRPFTDESRYLEARPDRSSVARVPVPFPAARDSPRLGGGVRPRPGPGRARRHVTSHSGRRGRLHLLAGLPGVSPRPVRQLARLVPPDDDSGGVA